MCMRTFSSAVWFAYEKNWFIYISLAATIGMSHLFVLLVLFLYLLGLYVLNETKQPEPYSGRSFG